MKTFIKKYLLKGSLVVLLGNGVASFLNYFYHFLCGRFLAPEQYGLLTSFIALLYFNGVFAGAFSLSIVNLVSPAKEALIWPLLQALEKRLVKISFLSWFVFLALFPLLKTFLHLEKFLIFLIFSWQVFFSFLAIIYPAIFQAKLEFFKFSLLGIVGPLVKIIFTFVFIFLGWQAAGALGALVVSTLATIFLGRFWIARHWQKKQKKKKLKPEISARLWQYSLFALGVNLALTMAYSVDVLLVRYYFSPLKAGIYSATSVLGKIIFFTASSILLVAFPLFIKYKKEFLKLRRAFWLSFVFLTTVCFLGLIGFKLYPHFFVGLLYRQDYSQATLFLPDFAVFISLFAVFNLLVRLFLALEKKVAVWLSWLVAASQILLIVTYHPNLETVIRNSTLSVGFGLLLGLFFANKILNASQR